ncbi:putative ammonium transporter 3 [Octopus vulgaris]|uniref:Ammonium transporter n=1 Tax=Octopus vulgaris TaxID=6645 RepID=A0AA36FB15_OCTVU|nr:putative ammonium transporter 3 [Octopus vulgaris]
MQSGFGLLESGSVSSKNEVNIMVKNAVDVIVGGLSFWMFGYALVYGEDFGISNPFFGWGDFFVSTRSRDVGWVYSKFFFTASFATTATTIVSGAMAERTKLESYMVFSMLNTFAFSIPAHWAWADNGWLTSMGFIDVAGAGPVHIVGGMTALIAALMLGPRKGRFLTSNPSTFGSPTNAVLGMFMLWWGWLGFNCGSTFGISGTKWILAARSAVSTITSSVAGGLTGLILSYVMKSRKFLLDYMINSVLGALVAITAFCALASPLDGIVIGSVAAVLSCICMELMNKLKIDDPVSCFSVHAVNGVWSLLSVGLFSREDIIKHNDAKFDVEDGLFWGGSARILKIQTVAALAISGWTVVVSYIFLKFLQLTIGLRVSEAEEVLGADIVEHNCGGFFYDKNTKKLINLNEQPAEIQNESESDTSDEDGETKEEDEEEKKKRKEEKKKRANERHLRNWCPQPQRSRVYFSAKPVCERKSSIVPPTKTHSPRLKSYRKSFLGTLIGYRNVLKPKSVRRRRSSVASSQSTSTNTLGVDNYSFDNNNGVQEQSDNMPNAPTAGNSSQDKYSVFTVENEMNRPSNDSELRGMPTRVGSVLQTYANPLFETDSKNTKL